MTDHKPVAPDNQLSDSVSDSPKSGTVSDKKSAQRNVSGGIVERLSSLLSLLKTKSKTTRIGLRDVIKVLNILIIILLFLLIIYFIWALPKSTRIPDLRVPVDQSKAAGLSAEDQSLSEIQEYLDKPLPRSIFKFGDMNNATPEEEVPAPTDEDATPDVLANFALAGIGFSDEPEAMIRDVETEEVFFLKKGEWLNEEIKVKDIFYDSVILVYKGKELELR